MIQITNLSARIILFLSRLIDKTLPLAFKRHGFDSETISIRFFLSFFLFLLSFFDRLFVNFEVLEFFFSFFWSINRYLI